MVLFYFYKLFKYIKIRLENIEPITALPGYFHQIAVLMHFLTKSLAALYDKEHVVAAFSTVVYGFFINE